MKCIKENNVVVEVLIVSRYKVTWQIVCAIIYKIKSRTEPPDTDIKQNRTSVLNWHFEAIIGMYT